MGARVRIEEILSRLDKVTGHVPGQWKSCCPAHPDRTPSLSIKLTDDGRILLHCFAGCEVADVCGAIGINMSDLMPEQNRFTGSRTQSVRPDKRQALDVAAHEVVVAVLILEDSQIIDAHLDRAIEAARRLREAAELLPARK